MRDMAYDPTTVYPEPERTSLAAILGFIFSLGGCCVGIPALLGLPLSIFALIGIGRSNGRVGGRGLAIAGLILSLLGIAAWGSCLGSVFVGLGQVEKTVFKPMDTFFTALESGDFDTARSVLAPPARQATDEELLAFHAAYSANLGNFVRRPAGVGEYAASFPQFGPFQSVISGRANAVPVLAEFQSAQGMIIWQMDPVSGTAAEIFIYDGALNEYSLPLQPPRPTTDTSSHTPDTPTADSPPATPDQPGADTP
jgi:hypothetical protein